MEGVGVCRHRLGDKGKGVLRAPVSVVGALHHPALLTTLSCLIQSFKTTFFPSYISASFRAHLGSSVVCSTNTHSPSDGLGSHSISWSRPLLCWSPHGLVAVCSFPQASSCLPYFQCQGVRRFDGRVLSSYSKQESLPDL